eukprot:gnl/MRDRNA2_/MRDRNA2_132159_c0_seq1.p1 gnl/MRDRNA2_/MRDRNA2_132159_c0~~gnl/MRDRNA2_/MRDRNA2_132159_c0_seq1.p1  ORF type:complete len:274 (-),score=24.95 gnl/MRDRNA2_/MRDRNA2_132159_c0_seq1:34-855(-)
MHTMLLIVPFALFSQTHAKTVSATSIVDMRNLRSMDEMVDDLGDKLFGHRGGGGTMEMPQQERIWLPRPDGSKIASDGTIMYEDGTIVYKDGSKHLRDGTKVSAEGVKTLKDGTEILPDGTKTLPDGTVIAPDGTIKSRPFSFKSLGENIGQNIGQNIFHWSTTPTPPSPKKEPIKFLRYKLRTKVAPAVRKTVRKRVVPVLKLIWNPFERKNHFWRPDPNTDLSVSFAKYVTDTTAPMLVGLWTGIASIFMIFLYRRNAATSVADQQMSLMV